MEVSQCCNPVAQNQHLVHLGADGFYKAICFSICSTSPVLRIHILLAPDKGFAIQRIGYGTTDGICVGLQLAAYLRRLVLLCPVSFIRTDTGMSGRLEFLYGASIVLIRAALSLRLEVLGFPRSLPVFRISLRYEGFGSVSGGGGVV